MADIAFEEREPFPFSVKRIHPDYQSVTERYFTAKFFIPKLTQTSFENPAADQVIMIHSNKIGIITLAPNHPIIKEQKAIDKIEFNESILNNSVTGKHKKGGFKLKSNSIIGKIYCKDGMIYTIVACMKATLIEINKKLINNPELLLNDTWSKGYIAIIQQFFNDKDSDKNLLNLDQYNEAKLKLN